MRIARNILATAARGLKPVARGTFGGGYGWSRSLMEGLDWRAEAGNRFDNSIVYAAISFACKHLPTVPARVRRRDGDGWKTVQNHPIELLLARPVPWYDGCSVASMWTVAEIVAGNSYSFKHRSSAGRLIGLEYLPLNVCWPYSTPGSGEFVSAYQVAIMDGGQMAANPRDVLHQRWFTRHPTSPALGLGPLEAVLPEIAIDNRAGRVEASVLRNMGVTPTLISPKSGDVNGQKVVFGKGERDQIMERFDESITGDNAGRPLVSPIPIDVQKIAMSLDEMGTEKLRNVSEERLCAVMGIPPTVLHLGTGLENENNRASKSAAIIEARDYFIAPYLDHRARQLTFGLIPELGAPGEEVFYDTSEIALWRDDEDATVERNGKRLEYMTLNEVRALAGLPPVEGGDVVRPPRRSQEPAQRP